MPPTFNLCACGCGEQTKSTWKTGHHRRAKGAKPTIATKPIKQRIAESTAETSSGCWEWQLSKCRDGYGMMKVAGKSLRAARVSYTEFRGDIPKGMLIYQSCKNRACVNPSHLEAITAQESVARGESDARGNFFEHYEKRRSTTHCPNGHPWDSENTRHNGIQRICRACLRENQRKRRQDPNVAANERERNRETYKLNRDKILERKRKNSRKRYAKAKGEGRCVYGGGGRCKELAAEGRVQCEYHLALSAARTWGIRKHPLHTIYKDRGIQTCWICDCEFALENPMCNDHLIPRSLGGPDEAWNLAPICRSCNSRRCNLPLNQTMRVAIHANVAVSDFPDEYLGYLN